MKSTSDRTPGANRAPRAMADRVAVIASDAIRVEVLPGIGARLHRLSVFGQDLLRTPEDPQTHMRDPFRWGGYVMAPWCNRTEAAITTVLGDLVDLPSNSADGTALHGQVHMSPWEERSGGMFAVRGGGDGWPWPYGTTLRLTAADNGPTKATLAIAQVLTNLSDRPMPGGLGIHPWFLEPIEVRIASGRILASNLEDKRESQPAAGDLDLRDLRAMPVGLDATWLDPGDPPVKLRWPDRGLSAVLEVESDAGICIVAASPAGTGAVAIEPETHAPYGLRRLLDGTPNGLVWIPPGGSIHLTTRMIFERSA